MGFLLILSKVSIKSSLRKDFNNFKDDDNKMIEERPLNRLKENLSQSEEDEENSEFR